MIVSTGDYWLFGSMKSDGVRIQEILRDAGTDFLRLHETQVRRGRVTLNTLPEMAIAKNKIDLLIVRGDAHEAAMSRFNNRATKSTLKCFFIAGSNCVEGLLHLPRIEHDSTYVLASQMGTFFPITQATVTCSDREQLSSPVTFARREAVSGLYVGETTTVEDSVLQAQTTEPSACGGPTEDSVLRLVAELKKLAGESTEGTTHTPTESLAQQDAAEGR